MKRLFIAFSLLLIVLGSSCQQADTAELTTTDDAVAFAAEATESSPTLIPSGTPIPAPTLTWTPSTTVPPTLTPPPTQTSTPTALPSATPTATETPTPTAVPINRRCPEESPARPDYTRNFLATTPWPTPVGEPMAHFNFIKPVPGGGRTIINKTFPYGSDGNGRYLLHNGIDIAGELGLPVLAVADGTVVVAQADDSALYGWRCNWYGHLIVLELDQTWQGQPIFVLYGHVLGLAVEVGQRVAQGEPIAEVGVGGAAIVPHLHLEVRVGTNEFGSTRNPMLWIHPGPTRGVVAGRLVDPQGRPWQGVTITLIDASEDEPLFINTYSYQGDPQNLINPDELLAENFVFADVMPGEYTLFVKLQGVEYRQPVQVVEGELTTVELVTEPYKTPTPTAEGTATPETTPTAVPTEEN
ncbi:peptidoglycan DD-metalloendopeptidase family protein [Candidatus Leptofilum sp.]|uniref:peptidoglycan DD-metalloendopeptidase family protein n=1 Tax=Candidatus Leptofilum sp. TaxID=3241576 RepID=UPI003B5C3496